MNKEKAIIILVNAVNLAQQRGAFNLNDAKVIAEAVEIVSVDLPKEEKTEEKESKKK